LICGNPELLFTLIDLELRASGSLFREELLLLTALLFESVPRLGFRLGSPQIAHELLQASLEASRVGRRRPFRV
jgi:hypothetical protein